MVGSRVFVFDDPHQYGAAIRAAQIEMYPTAAGKFHSELVQCDLGAVWMQHMSEDKPRVAYGVVDRTRIIIEFLTGSDQQPMKHSGIDVVPGEVIINGSPVAHRRSFDSCQFGTMSLSNEYLAELSQKLLGHSIAKPQVTQSIRPHPQALSGLQALHDASTQLARKEPSKLRQPEIARTLEQGLARSMIYCIADSEAEFQHTENMRRSTVISRLEEVLASHRDRPLHLAEICQATGIPERTLRVYCHEHLGVGPIKYLWLRRMFLVRAALLRASAAVASVTGIASDYGFWELGRFAVQYRTLFGERPSETLHRPPIDFQVIETRPFELPQRA